MAAPNDTKRNDAPEQPEKKDAPQEQANVPTLGALDEDDEFEEFETEEWPDQDTEVQTAGAGTDSASAALDMSGATRAGGDHLWEDNWDDDDVEDIFSKALRAELEKTNAPEAMAT